MHTYVKHYKTVQTESGPVKVPEFLAPDTVVNYMFIMLNMAKQKYKVNGQPTSKNFLMCLDVGASTDAAHWLRGLKNNIKRDLFIRAIRNGEIIDKSETPLYSEHTKMINKAFASEGSSKSVMYKFAVTSLQRSAGRSSEVDNSVCVCLKYTGQFRRGPYLYRYPDVLAE